MKRGIELRLNSQRKNSKMIWKSWHKQLVIVLAFLFLISSIVSVSMGQPSSGEEPLGGDIVFNGELNVSAAVTTWKGDKTAAVSLTFDDGLASHVDRAAPQMSSRNLFGTFFVTLDHVGIDYGAEWWEWQYVSNSGHEVSSHTIHHWDLPTLTPAELWEEVVLSRQYIMENLSVSCDTFSYPYGSYDGTVLDLVKDHYLFARADDHNITGPPAPVSNNPPDLYTVVPVNFGAVESPTYMAQLVQDAVNMEGWLVEMIHAVEEGGWDPVPEVNFTAHLDYLLSRNDDVWVSPYGNVAKYITERENSQLDINVLSNQSFNVFLNSTLDKTVYDEELTLNITVPMDWIDVVVELDGKDLIFTSIPYQDNRSFLLNLPINSTVNISQALPSLHFVEVEDGNCFSPDIGDSDTIFTFMVNYSSHANRSPGSAPEFLLDLNGDGDILDRIGSMDEGRYSMEKLDVADMDYTDGCLYTIQISFPVFSKLNFSFNASDDVGQWVLDPDFMTIMMPGPIIRDHVVLKPGWNMISTPFIQGDTDLTSVLSEIDGLYNIVECYDNSNNDEPWSSYKVGKSLGNDLEELNNKNGFWIYSTEPADTILHFNGTVPTVNQTVQLYKGWNLVGYPSLTSHARTQALNGLSFGTLVDAIQWFDASTKTWHFMEEEDSFVVGRGYWVHSNVEVSWEVPL